MTKIKIIDTETTSADNPKLIEYGEAIINLNVRPPDEELMTDEDQTGTVLLGDDFEFGDMTVSRFNPGVQIQYGAMATHGFTNEDVAEFPPLSEFVYEPCDYLIGHNISFDATVVGDTTSKLICTLALSRKIWPELDSHKLLALMYFLHPKEAKDWHSSAHGVETDIDMTHWLLCEIVDQLAPSNIEDLYRMSEDARIPEIMSFSKFKGQHVSAVDPGWRSWYAKQESPDPFLLKAFDKYPYRKP